jgi:hypothetical protein
LVKYVTPFFVVAPERVKVPMVVLPFTRRPEPEAEVVVQVDQTIFDRNRFAFVQLIAMLYGLYNLVLSQPATYACAGALAAEATVLNDARGAATATTATTDFRSVFIKPILPIESTTGPQKD